MYLGPPSLVARSAVALHHLEHAVRHGLPDQVVRPVLTIRAPKNVIWAQIKYSMGIHISKYLLGPKNSSRGSQSRGGSTTQRYGRSGSADSTGSSGLATGRRVI